MSFSDAQRAAVYVRDRAICAFSGKSLWILDHGATPFWDVDWVDHIRPLSRGGRSTLDNAACVSAERNWARRNNGADNRYLFRSGRPTEFCIYELGEIPKIIGDRLRRFAALEVSDWYFNRALSHILIYLQIEFEGGCPVRDRKYWCKAAATKLAQWQKMTHRPDYRTFEQRGLIPRRPTPDVTLMLSLRALAGRPDALVGVIRTARKLLPYYLANANAVWRFVEAKTDRRRAAIVQLAGRNRWIRPATLQSLKRSHARLTEGASRIAAD
nr:HNH endonuclease signature motif containing protein [Nitrosomonas nitrosa]